MPTSLRPRKRSRGFSSKPSVGSADGRRRLSPAARRQELLEALARTVTERGYQATTVPEVVARAGAAQGTFYRYFANVDQAFIALVAERLDPIEKAVRGFAPARASSAAELEELIYQAHGPLSALLAREPVLLREALLVASASAGAAGAAMARVLREMRQLLRGQIAAVNGRPPFRSLDPQIVAGAAMGMLIGAIQEAAEAPAAFDVEAWRREIARLETGMLVSRENATETSERKDP